MACEERMRCEVVVFEGGRGSGWLVLREAGPRLFPIDHWTTDRTPNEGVKRNTVIILPLRAGFSLFRLLCR